MKIKKCRTCDQEFEFISVKDVDCQGCKRNKDIKKSNKNWLTRKPRKKNNIVTNNIGYCFNTRRKND